MSNWAGDFECNQCGLKRLTAQSFSKKAIDNYRKHNKSLRCKSCVELSATLEREQATAKAQAQAQAQAQLSTQSQASDEAALVLCSSCDARLFPSNFNTNQLRKGSGKQRCRQCVTTAEDTAMVATSVAKNAKLKKAQEEVENTAKTGTAAQQLAASSKLSALEAELVTGLKPMKLGPKGRKAKGFLNK
ncbi:hypothetical protein ScalyP_jg9756 [Parmales sp. scaly parma]|nr:hypothetical protein ScalyP_jg9756 [Parmales sp. scaly parma]